MADKRNQDKTEINGIPTVCQYQNLSSQDKELENETPDWLKERGNLPLWSRLKSTNCTGQPRGAENSKEGNYEIEIPGHLLSVFGNIKHQTDCMNNMKDKKGYHLLSNVFALCAILKHDYQEWSEDVLDQITSTACSQYPDLMQKLAIMDKELKISHLNQLFTFNDLQFKIQLQQAAKGFIYIRYGLYEFNLARVLPWFFQQYQFGVLQCANRTLAFGQTLDCKYAFFMYDCQSCGHPLFEDQQTNSYILRTNHLQVLLYCLTMTLNVSTQMTPFIIYNADIVMAYPSERQSLKKEVYVPIIGQAPTANPIEKLFDSAVSNKPVTNNTTTVAKKNNDKISKSKTFKTSATSKKITLDPDKMYYIIAVPKKSTSLSAKFQSKQLLFPKINSQNFENTSTENSENVPVNIHRFKKQEDDEEIQEGETETIILSSKTTSTETLAPNMAQANVLKNPNTLGLKVYLVDESGGSELNKSITKNRIKIAHQLRDFFIK